MGVSGNYSGGAIREVEHIFNGSLSVGHMCKPLNNVVGNNSVPCQSRVLTAQCIIISSECKCGSGPPIINNGLINELRLCN